MDKDFLISKTILPSCHLQVSLTFPDIIFLPVTERSPKDKRNKRKEQKGQAKYTWQNIICLAPNALAPNALFLPGTERCLVTYCIYCLFRPRRLYLSLIPFREWKSHRYHEYYEFDL